MEKADLKTIITSPEARSLLVNLFVEHGRAYHSTVQKIKTNELTDHWATCFQQAQLINNAGTCFHLTDLGKTIGYGLLEVANIEKRLLNKTTEPVDIPLSPSSLFTDKNVIDIGCGTGCYTAMASKNGAKIAIGIDVQQPLLKTAKILHNNSNIIFLTGSADQLPIASQTADLIILRGILAYVDNHTLLKEISRISKPGCQLFLTTQGAGYFLTALKNGLTHLQILRVIYLLVVLCNGLLFTLSGKRIPLRIKKYFSKELITIFHTQYTLRRLLRAYGYTITSLTAEKTSGPNAHFFISARNQ